MADHRIFRPLLAAGLIALAGAAGAQTTEPPAAETAADSSPKPGIAGGHSQAAFITAHDRDGDGKVSLDEVIATRTDRLTGADADGDGRYSEAEYVAEYEARLRRQYADQGRAYDPADTRIAGNLEQAAVRFALLDRDRDGFLTLEEDLASARKTFAHNDTDGDGFVTAADPKPKRADDGDADQAEGDQVGPAAN